MKEIIKSLSRCWIINPEAIIEMTRKKPKVDNPTTKLDVYKRYYDK